MPEIAYFALMFFAAGYILSSSLECALLFRGYVLQSAYEEKFFSCLRFASIISNVFFVYIFAIFLLLFPRATSLLSPLYNDLLLFLLFFALRAAGVIGAYYLPLRSRRWHALSVFGSMGSLITFSSVYIFFLTGEISPAQPVIFFLLAGILMSACIMIPSSFALLLAETNPKRALENIQTSASACFFLFAAGFVSAISPLVVLPKKGSYLLAIIALLITLSFILRERHFSHRAFVLDSLSVVFLVCGIMYLRMPYLLFPSLTIQDAFTTSVLFQSPLPAFFFGLLFLMPGVLPLTNSLILKTKSSER